MSKVRIGDLFEVEKGSLQSSKCTEGEFDFITASKEWKTHNDFSHDIEALIFAAMASGSLGRTHYVNGKFITSDLCYILTPKNSEKYPIDLKFYHFVFNSLKDEIVKNTKSGTSKKAINQTNLKNYEIPYFDIEQQHLWIEKLLKTKSIKEKLTVEIDTQQTLLKKLRQKILQDAIEGKLTTSWREQNSDVKSASVLLEKIKAEKEQLIKDKKIKKEKSLPPINEDDIPFDIPDSWKWSKINELIKDLQYGTSKKCSYTQNMESPILRIPNVSSGYIDINDLKYTKLTDKEKEQYSLEIDDLLVVRSNGSRELVGKSVLVSRQLTNYGYAGYLIRLRFFNKNLNAPYIQCFFNSPYIREQIETPLRTTVGINNINSTELSNLIIPIPPLEEQKEIVKKIESLFKVCDALEEQINSSQKNSQILMQSVLKEAFEK